jgi:hypothetical protein
VEDDDLESPDFESEDFESLPFPSLEEDPPSFLEPFADDAGPAPLPLA